MQNFLLGRKGSFGTTHHIKKTGVIDDYNMCKHHSSIYLVSQMVWFLWSYRNKRIITANRFPPTKKSLQVTQSHKNQKTSDNTIYSAFWNISRESCPKKIPESLLSAHTHAWIIGLISNQNDHTTEYMETYTRQTPNWRRRTKKKIDTETNQIRNPNEPQANRERGINRRLKKHQNDLLNPE